MDARAGNLKQKCARASSESCTSATGKATGSVSLRVMVSGDTVMPEGEEWMTLIKSHYFNSYTSRRNQQARIQLIKLQLKCPLLPSEIRLCDASWHRGIRFGQLGGCCWRQSALTWPAVSLCSVLLCISAWICTIWALSTPVTCWYFCAYRGTRSDILYISGHVFIVKLHSWPLIKADNQIIRTGLVYSLVLECRFFNWHFKHLFVHWLKKM